MKLPEFRVPAWYRGLANTQVKAARRLHIALNHDLEQRTTRRVHDCLLQIGIMPLVDKQQLYQIMTLSRGHELAFLYFLMSAYYKSTASGDNYSLNEQLFMSTIALLDMPMTMQALDRMLPVAASPDQQHKSACPSRCRSVQTTAMGTTPHGSVAALPYFQKQPRPKLHPSPAKNMRTPPAPKAPATEKTIPNAANPWFANYQLQPVKRMVKRIVSEELNTLFEKIDGFQLVGKDMLCDYHSALRDVEKDRYLVEARQRCLQLMESHRKENTRCRIIKQLECDVERYLNQFDTSTLSNQRGTRECAVCNQFVERSMVLRSNHEKDDCRPKLESCNVERLSGGQESRAGLRQRRPLGDCSNIVNVSQKVKLKAQRQQRVADLAFFRPSTKHTPYAFDYSRVFDVCAAPADAADVIKAAAVRALRDDKPAATQCPFNGSCSLRQLAPSQRLSVVEAVAQCTQAIWCKYRATEAAAKPKAQQRLSYEGREHFNGSDDTLMEQMLSEALQQLRQDPKYVLASLPDCQRLPELWKWIRNRYGLASKLNGSSSDGGIYQKIRSMSEHFTLPQPRMLPDSGELTYADRQRCLRKAQPSNNQFRCVLREKILERARFCWNALRLGDDSSSCLRQIFFAYLPNCMRDIPLR